MIVQSNTMLINIFKICLIVTIPFTALCVRKFSPARKAKLREDVRGMFQHAYEGYLQHASDYDELRPLTCDGINTWGSYSLTLIDALDTLAVIGNYTEFRRIAKLIIKKINFDNDINVSVFETNIRIVGGLLSAHLMAHKAGMELEPGWPCNGPLLRLAEDVAKRLLPAFESKTGMPYGTVNLRRGIPPGETSVTCTAGVGTFIIEFGALSRLTGDPIYEEVALNAIYSLWEHRSQIGLLGNHIDVQTGRWTAQDAGIGAGVDSFFEYLVKGAIMLNRPELLDMFYEARRKIDNYMKRDDWYVWVGMSKGQVTLPVFQSLEAYWPGVLSLIGDISPAMKTLHNYHTVWRQYGFLPEFYNIPGAEAGANRESYPLRPELAESAMYLYRATRDSYLLEVGEDMLRSIEYSAKTSCGYATIRNVRDHRRDNRMESFFLSETTKYLYLLFDEDNFLHNNGGEGQLFETPNGVCIIEAGGYIFNTEAHPIDPSALHCCHNIPRQDIFADFNLQDYHGDVLFQKERHMHEQEVKNSGKYTCPDFKVQDYIQKDLNLTIDIEVMDAKESGIDIANEMLANFQKIQNEALHYHQAKPFTIRDLLDAINNVSTVQEMPTALLDYMQERIVDPEKVRMLFNISTPLEMDLSKPHSIWTIYVKHHRLRANILAIEALGIQKIENQIDGYALLRELLDVLNCKEEQLDRYSDSKIFRTIIDIQRGYHEKMANSSEMFIFTILFAEDSKTNLVNWELAQTRKTLSSVASSDLSHDESIINLQLFEKLQKIAKFKMSMIETLQKLKTLMENNDRSENPDVDQEMTTSNKPIVSDDLITVDTNKQEAIENTINTKKTQLTNRILKQKSESAAEESENNSILSEFVHSIIKSTLPPKPKFDEQMFLKNIRTQGGYMNQTQRYELLTCAAPKFAERFAYRYEVV